MLDNSDGLHSKYILESDFDTCFFIVEFGCWLPNTKYTLYFTKRCKGTNKITGRFILPWYTAKSLYLNGSRWHKQKPAHPLPSAATGKFPTEVNYDTDNQQWWSCLDDLLPVKENKIKLHHSRSFHSLFGGQETTTRHANSYKQQPTHA